MRSPCSDRKDKKLDGFVQAHGEGHRRSLPPAAGPLRCGESCRLRWINHLRPDVKRGNFSEDEEDLIIKLHALLGNRWSLIAGRLPGRTDNEIKHYWNSHLRRKLASMGIDPNNHRVNQCTMQWCSSRNNYKLKGQFEHPGNASDDGSLSDTASCVKDEACSRVVPDLNLDLTISSPHDRVAAGEQEDMSSPTLVLFR